MLLVNERCISFEDLSAKMKMNIVVCVFCFSCAVYSNKTIMIYFMVNGDETKENMRKAVSFGYLIIQPEEKD